MNENTQINNKITVEAHELTKIFPHPSKPGINYPLFANTSFTMKDGRFNFLMGPSGSGKSTFLKMLLGIEPISAGELSVGRYNLVQITAKERQTYLQTIGYMDQFSSRYLSLSLTVKQNLDYSLALYQKNPPEVQQQKIQSIAEAFGLENLLEQKTAFLSGGELRRLGVACNLVFGPRILLCDEPTAQLDKENKTQLMDFLSQYIKQESILIIIATHDRAIVTNGSVYKIHDRRIQECQ